MEKKISVIIPNFNDPRIERTLKSITSQNTNDYEIIVIEGCNDNEKTGYIYQKYKSNITVLIQEPDKGIFDALNKGILQAKGELILLLGSDDYIPSTNSFNRLLEFYGQNNDVDGFCFNAKIINKNGKIIRNWSPSSVTSSKMKWGLLPHHFSLVLKKSIYDEVGLFELSHKDIAIDTIWLLKLAKYKNLTIQRIKEYDIYMEVGGLSTGSYKSILEAFILTMQKSKELGYKNYLFIPFIKVFSKIFQFRF